MMKLHRPALYFANALLAAVDVLYFSKYVTLRLRIRTSKLIIDKRILFDVRWQGRRFDSKIWVQAKTVTKRKAPKLKTFRIKDCCRTKNSWKKNKCALAQKVFSKCHSYCGPTVCIGDSTGNSLLVCSVLMIIRNVKLKLLAKLKRKRSSP